MAAGAARPLDQAVDRQRVVGTENLIAGPAWSRPPRGLVAGVIFARQVGRVIGPQDRRTAAAEAVGLDGPHDAVGQAVGRDHRGWAGEPVGLRGRRGPHGRPARTVDGVGVDGAVVARQVDPAVEVGRRGEGRPGQPAGLHDVVVGVGRAVVAPQAREGGDRQVAGVAVQHVVVALLAADQGVHVGHAALDHRRQQQHARGAQVDVVILQPLLVVRGEEVADAQPRGPAGGELHDAVAVVAPAGQVGVEGAVARGHVDIALLVGRGGRAASPDAPSPPSGVVFQTATCRRVAAS